MITEYSSPNSPEQTVDRLISTIETKGLKIIQVLDHAKAAAGADLELGPTTLIIFGNPALGTKLMQIDQRLGLDLPLKIVVWQSQDGATSIGYHDISQLLKEQGVTVPAEMIETVQGVMKGIVEEATA